MRYRPTEFEIDSAMRAWGIDYLQARERVIAGHAIRERQNAEARRRAHERAHLMHAEALANG